MPKFQKAPPDVREMCDALLNEFESHKPLVENKVKIDLIFAFADTDDDTGEKLNDALTLHGHKALGITRKLGAKDRVMGRGDAEIVLDGDWWTETASEEQQRALLDHELHHVAVKTKKGAVQHDDLGRPQINLRKHDVEFGWFAVIADRHGKHSQEQIQAATILDAYGQYFWPQLAPPTALKVLKK